MLEVKLIPKRDNFRFIDPVSGLHLTLLHNKGVVESTTPFIENGMTSRVIEVIDITPAPPEELVESKMSSATTTKKSKKTK